MNDVNFIQEALVIILVVTRKKQKNPGDKLEEKGSRSNIKTKPINYYFRSTENQRRKIPASESNEQNFQSTSESPASISTRDIPLINYKKNT